MAEMLRDGKLIAHAERTFMSGARGINDAWKSRNIKGAEFDHDVDLDFRDWRASVQWSSDVDLWRWPENRFVVTLQRSPIERQFVEGVTFARSEIERLAAGHAPTAKLSGKGGTASGYPAMV